MDERKRETNAEYAGPPLGVKVAFLSDPASHPGVAEVDVRQTHMAWVFLAGDRAYKMKKPVRRPFLDYSTLEARRWICEEEVRLNRRLAPDVYLGVSPLTVAPNGTLAIDGEGEVAEWLVTMRRLPESLLLDAVIRDGGATQAQIDAVAARLADFYRDLPPERLDPEEHIGRFAHELAENRRVLGNRAFDGLAAEGVAISAQMERYLERSPEVVAERVRAGKIVEGHGDLRPEHVCLSDPPVVIDCLEFSRNLRLIDPYDELGFLAMECAVMGAGWIRPVLLARATKLLGDPPGAELQAFYTAQRAALRARQSLAHLLDPHPRTPAKWIPLARRYLDQAREAALSLPR